MMSINLKSFLATIIIFIVIIFVPKHSKSADKEYGKYIASECSSCHTKTEKSNVGIPSINGRSFEYLATALNEYKNKNRKNPIMQMVAERLDREQIDALAAYYSSLK